MAIKGRPRKYSRPLCKQCNKVEVKRPTSNFCSPQCYGGWRAENNIRIGRQVRSVYRPLCRYCNKIEVKKARLKYCSKRCEGLDRKLDNIFCNNCQISFKPRTSATKYCSLKCSRKSLKGRKFSREQRLRMSKAATQRNAKSHYTKGNGGTRKDIGHYVRSRWEANTARWLKHLGRTYIYEAETFILEKPDGSLISYIPDFQVGDLFIEVKGWWDKKSLLKKQLMEEQYPNIKVFYLDQPRYERLCAKYSEFIKNWELDNKRGGKR